MRKLRPLLALAASALMALTGCQEVFRHNDDKVWDFACPDVRISVADELGNDLLDPDSEGGLSIGDIFVSYKGSKYTVEETADEGTKANIAFWEGLRLKYSEYYQCWQLLFGEFDPVKEYKNESFTIDWGNNRGDKITFDLYITWKNGNPTVHQHTYLNGTLNHSADMLVNIVL